MVFFRGNKEHYSLKVNDMRKKTKKAGVLAAIGMASALIAACGSKNEQFKPDENIASTLYAPEYSDSDDFDSAQNEPYEVYGPAPEDEKPSGDSESSGETSPGISWRLDTSDNSGASDVSTNLKEVKPGGDFKPADNIAEPVYGPPAGTEEATE